MPDEFDKLVEQEARLRKVSRMVPTTGPLTDTKRAEIRQALEAFMREHGLTQADVAKAIGRKTTYVNNLLNEAATLPVATRDEMYRDLNNWMDREARARANRRPDDFVVTRVAERMFALAERLVERADMAVAYGPAGAGKTKTIEALIAEIPTAIAITADHDSRYPTGLLRKLYNSVSRKKRLGPARLEEVVEKLRKPERIATHNLVVVDQAHVLHDRSIRLLAELADQAQCSVLLIGTVDLKTRVSSDDDPEYGQLSSRFGMRINLAPELTGSFAGSKRAAECFSVADIRKIFHRSKIKLHPDAARMLCEIANRHRGTLRRVSRLFDWAEVAARKKHSAEITVAHVKAAMRVVEAEIVLDGAQAPSQVPSRAAEVTA